ncbi:MAG: hypothetical protein QNJ42_18670 [Crocosphaera sp.]|nr:hypothetical protein [Crocosphaera sp.]
MTKPTDNSLNFYLLTLLKPKTPEQLKQSNYFFAYVKRLLRQHYLGDVDAHEVLSESVIRLIRYMNKYQTEVKNYEAILKRISLHVIYEISRKQRLKLRVDYDTIEHTLTSKQSGGEQVYQTIDNLRLLDSLWKQLSPIDSELLILRIMRGLNWKTISTLFSEKNPQSTLNPNS